MIISGNYFERYEYDKSINRDFTREAKPKKKEKEQLSLPLEEKMEIIGKRSDSISRTRSKIRRIIQSNPDLTKFVTLTFRKNMTDVAKANKIFSKFIMRLNYRYPNFKYISIIEFQKRGAVHYHFLCNLPFIKNTLLAEIWDNGNIKINKIKHVDNLGAYVCKYLQKDMNDKRLFQKKKYFCSKNIELPVEVYDDKIIGNLILQYDLDNVQFTYRTEFSVKYIGKIKYTVYKLNNCIA